MLDDESPSSRLLLGFCHTFAPLSHNFIIVVFVVVVTFVVAVLQHKQSHKNEFDYHKIEGYCDRMKLTNERTTHNKTNAQRSALKAFARNREGSGNGGRWRRYRPNGEESGMYMYVSVA